MKFNFETVNSHEDVVTKKARLGADIESVDKFIAKNEEDIVAIRETIQGLLNTSASAEDVSNHEARFRELKESLEENLATKAKYEAELAQLG